MKYRIGFSPRARRQLTDVLPEAVAAAAAEFIHGPVAENPHRVGKRMKEPQSDKFTARRGTYRVIYMIDDESNLVTIMAIGHRADVYHL